MLCVRVVTAPRCVLFDLCARLQAVVQEMWELYVSGLAAYVG